jgi:hypothetical protein
MDKLFALPVAIQLALGSGYIAYLIAFAGIRGHHTTTDAFFGSLAFGMVTTLLFMFLPCSTIWKMVISVAVTILVGAAWRWRLGQWAKAALRFSNVSWTDDIPSAWLSITAQRTDLPVSQIAVDIDDGRTVVCDDTRSYKDAPHGPCVLGLDGSVALYVTSEWKEDTGWTDATDVRNIDGSRITFVPANRIRRIELRFWEKTSGKGAQAAAQD